MQLFMLPQNQLAMNNVTQEEINIAEKILLPSSQSFGTEEGERVQIIKDISNSCHVVACPGSGKTTVLLAKLLILAERMPFENNQGICVLTHTNVAIDEIKRKSGTAGDKLFQYPNFFGTIQSFVDKYLAKQALIKFYNSVPSIIDSDVADKKLISLFKKLPFESKLNGKLWRELYENEATLNKEDINELFELKNDQINDFLSNYIRLGILEKNRTKYILKKNKTEIKRIVTIGHHRNLFLALRGVIEDEINKKKIEKHLLNKHLQKIQSLHNAAPQLKKEPVVNA